MATYYVGAYFTLTDVEKMRKTLGKEGIRVIKVKKRKAGFPLAGLTVYEVHSDKKPSWQKSRR